LIYPSLKEVYTGWHQSDHHYAEVLHRFAAALAKAFIAKVFTRE
jgi:hypothetical protein